MGTRAEKKANKTIQHAHDMGLAIANLLQLRPLRNPAGRYQTNWGDKTPTGLYLTLKRIIKEDKVEIF